MIAQAIEALRYAPVEIGYAFDATGRQVFRQVGDADEIRGFDQRDLAMVVNGTFVHSHPPYAQLPQGDPRRRAGSFSARDLVFMYENGLAEIVAVTTERTYFLRSKERGLFLDPDQIREMYADEIDKVTAFLYRLARRGIISIEEAESQGRLADEVMIRLSLFFEYHWVEGRQDAPRS